MGFLSDLKVLYHLVLKPVRGKNHAERMDNFYGGQAEAYDDFRKRLLKGRGIRTAHYVSPSVYAWRRGRGQRTLVMIGKR